MAKTRAQAAPARAAPPLARRSPHSGAPTRPARRRASCEQVAGVLPQVAGSVAFGRRAGASTRLVGAAVAGSARRSCRRDSTIVDFFRYLAAAFATVRAPSAGLEPAIDGRPGSPPAASSDPIDGLAKDPLSPYWAVGSDC